MIFCAANGSSRNASEGMNLAARRLLSVFVSAC